TLRRPPRSPLFPYTTLFRSRTRASLQRKTKRYDQALPRRVSRAAPTQIGRALEYSETHFDMAAPNRRGTQGPPAGTRERYQRSVDRKSTRLNSSHVKISYAV